MNGYMNEWKGERNEGWMNTCRIEQGLGKAGGIEVEESWLFR